VEKLVDDIQGGIEGNALNLSSGYNKRGWVRVGGETAPSLRMPWPQDYIFNFGRDSKIYYEDLDIFQWVLGYAAIIEAHTDNQIARHMLVHLQNLMGDAQSHGFEVIKYAHGVILSRLEMGKLAWSEVHEMSEARRTAITRGVKQCKISNNQAGFNSRGNSANRQFSSNQSTGGARNVQRQGGKAVRVCLFYNDGSCSQKSDHETNTVLYRHVCKRCWKSDHVENECFLA
jgi:hypothetical protein